MPPTTRILLSPANALRIGAALLTLSTLSMTLRPDRIAERIAALPLDRINRRLESSDQRRQMSWQGRPALQRLDGGVYRAARFAPKYHDQRRLKHLHSVSQAGHHFVAGEIAGDAANKQVATRRVEAKFGSDARIGATSIWRRRDSGLCLALHVRARSRAAAWCL